MANFITTDFLNLRREPRVAPGNVISVMPPDTVVQEMLSEASTGWRKVKTVSGNSPIEGFASEKYLQSTELPLPPVDVPMDIPAVHYPPGNRVIRRNGTGRAYPLNEPGLIKVDLLEISDAEARRKVIHDVVNYLDVENSIRYAPVSPNTYCNIYAYDVAYCLGAYLPRVWWTADAIVKIKQQIQVQPVYDNTVTEFTANRIADWFEKYGTSFAWQRLFNVAELQDEVNKGWLGIIVGQRINMNNSGHIVAVVPENDNVRASRDSNSIVSSPLQSQAGLRNRKYYTGSNWWEDSTRFKKFGFWVKK